MDRRDTGNHQLLISKCKITKMVLWW
jgi:hypothetical protein